MPVLGLYGGADTGIPLDSVQKMREELGRGQERIGDLVYDGAPHAFFADYRPSYRKAAAADGWKRMLAWFKTHGVEAPGVVEFAVEPATPVARRPEAAPARGAGQA